jgi:hypothetical protein
MLYDPAWEKNNKAVESPVKKRSLLDIIRKLTPSKMRSKKVSDSGNRGKGKVLSRIFNALFY